jgi:hypothetical protein
VWPESDIHTYRQEEWLPVSTRWCYSGSITFNIIDLRTGLTVNRLQARERYTVQVTTTAAKPQG